MDIRSMLSSRVDDISELKKYNIETTYDGIIMKDYSIFIDKLMIMLHLWSQVEDNKINYLIGGNLAIELALQGCVYKKIKYNNCYKYREHNNFDIYNVDKDSDNFYNNSKYFFEVFSPNVYLKGRSKMLDYLEKDFFDNLYDKVIINNTSILIPPLEILFLDGYLALEKGRREEGYDYQLLLNEYDLDLDKVLSYLEAYYINYHIDFDNKKYDNLASDQISAIERILNTGKKLDRSIQNLEEQISSYPSGSNKKYAGIYVDLWIPLDINDVTLKNGKYHITNNNYINKLKTRVFLYRENDMQRYEEISEDIKKIFEESRKKI